MVIAMGVGCTDDSYDNQADPSIKRITEYSPYQSYQDESDIMLHNKGSSYIREQRYDKAEAIFTQLTEKAPESLDAHYMLGSALSHSGKFNLAKESYKRAIDLNPQYHFSYTGLATVYSKESKYMKSILYYKKAIDIEPNLAFSHLCIALKYEKIGQYEKAIEHHERVIEIMPNSMHAQSSRGFINRIKLVNLRN